MLRERGVESADELAPADKIHNARLKLRDLRKPDVGKAVWSKFNQPKKNTLWYYRQLSSAFGRRLPGQLASELGEIVAALEAD